MDREFSQEEITQIARAARVLAPGFSEEQLDGIGRFPASTGRFRVY